MEKNRPLLLVVGILCLLFALCVVFAAWRNSNAPKGLLLGDLDLSGPVTLVEYDASHQELSRTVLDADASAQAMELLSGLLLDSMPCSCLPAVDLVTESQVTIGLHLDEEGYVRVDHWQKSLTTEQTEQLGALLGM